MQVGVKSPLPLFVHHFSGCSSVFRARALGARGRRLKSCHPDHFPNRGNHEHVVVRTQTAGEGQVGSCDVLLPPDQFHLGVAQLGRARVSGTRGRRIEACHPDHL